MKSTCFVALMALVAAPALVSAQGEKAVVLRMFELVNTHQVGALGEVVAESFVDNGPSAGGGLPGFKKGVAMMHGSFPDLHFAVEDLTAEGDRVAVRGTLSGTFTGNPLFGVAATGRHANWLSIMTFRVVDGKIVERWTTADTWGMLGKVGVLPYHEWDMSEMAVPGARNEKAERANKRAAQRLIEKVWISRDLASVESFFARGGGVTSGVPAGGGMLVNPAVIRMVGSNVFAAFPDFEASIDYILAEGNKVVLSISETGTQTGDYLGVPATNKKVRWNDAFYLTYADGKITEAWLQSNQMGLMSQLGAFHPQAPGGVVAEPGTMTLAQQNEKVFRRFIEEFWNQRNFAVADELIAPEHFSSSLPMLPPGPEGMKAIGGIVATQIFPDLQREIVQIFATDTMAGAVWINKATHQGTYMNIPGTGKHVEWMELGIARIENGKMVESWYRPDELGLCRELAPEVLAPIHF